MLRSLFILSALAFSLLAPAQKTDTLRNNQVKISLFRLLDVLQPGLELSYERFHGQRFSTQVTFAYPTNILGKPYDGLGGYRLGLEEKYFSRKGQRPGRYRSVALEHNQIRFDATTLFRDTINNISYTDSFTVRRKITAFNILTGRQLYYRRFIMDFQIGIGVKYRYVRNEGRTGEFIWPREPFDFFKLLQAEKKDFAFNMPVNIRLGYRF